MNRQDVFNFAVIFKRAIFLGEPILAGGHIFQSEKVDCQVCITVSSEMMYVHLLTFLQEAN